MSRRLIVLIGAASLFGCGSRPVNTGEEPETLTGYLYSPRSAICITQTADPALPDFDAALDTVVSSRPASELLANGSLDDLCGADSEAPVTSFRLLQDVSDIGCTPQNMRGCLEGEIRYTITGAYEQTKVCSLVAKGEPPACEIGTLFVPTGVEAR